MKPWFCAAGGDGAVHQAEVGEYGIFTAGTRLLRADNGSEVA
jgi:hypothetical protein